VAHELRIDVSRKKVDAEESTGAVHLECLEKEGRRNTVGDTRFHNGCRSYKSTEGVARSCELKIGVVNGIGLADGSPLRRTHMLFDLREGILFEDLLRRDSTARVGTRQKIPERYWLSSRSWVNTIDGGFEARGEGIHGSP
jgi:hypothetical protein